MVKRETMGWEEERCFQCLAEDWSLGLTQDQCLKITQNTVYRFSITKKEINKQLVLEIQK